MVYPLFYLVFNLLIEEEDYTYYNTTKNIISTFCMQIKIGVQFIQMKGSMNCGTTEKITRIYSWSKIDLLIALHCRL